ncbi:MAG: CehA/McbA family metallohydrolase [Hyphomicrobiaceae bacterium]|nr:CehA/McbA family metallohydrolase [Hyphomicrobiaceae bacterium]
MQTQFEFRLTRQDREASDYFYAPFDVPAGTTRIDIEIAYEKSAAVELDFGLLGPDATDFPSEKGLRGWSGAARDAFFVATDDATPGYIHGPIDAGEWRVIIGLCRIPAEGIGVRLAVTLDQAARPVAAQSTPTIPVRPGAGWYRGDLHCHTFHSDADGSPETLHAAARQAGLDFLAVADHNTISQRRYFYPASSPELVFVRATEITTVNGHANVYGIAGMVDHRLEKPDDVHRLVAHVHARGGIMSINHDKPTIPWHYALPAVDCMEVWQSTWIEWNWISLARYQHRLASGLRISAIGGSDYHQPMNLEPEGPFVLARPTTVLYLEELSEAAILKAMKSGHGYITENPAGPHLAITAGGQPMGSLLRAPKDVRAEVRGAAGDRLVWVDASGEIESALIPSDEWTMELRAPERIESFIRAEIVAEASYARLWSEVQPVLPDAPMSEELLPVAPHQPFRRALSNPIYFGR